MVDVDIRAPRFRVAGELARRSDGELGEQARRLHEILERDPPVCSHGMIYLARDQPRIHSPVRPLAPDCKSGGRSEREFLRLITPRLGRWRSLNFGWFIGIGVLAFYAFVPIITVFAMKRADRIGAMAARRLRVPPFHRGLRGHLQAESPVHLRDRIR